MGSGLAPLQRNRLLRYRNHIWLTSLNRNRFFSPMGSSLVANISTAMGWMATTTKSLLPLNHLPAATSTVYGLSEDCTVPY